jgi:hypothetical protein
MILSLFVAGLVYGGLHLLAWNPPVRTATETWIWRPSSVGIIAYGTVAEALAIIKSLRDYHYNSLLLYPKVALSNFHVRA